MTTPNEPADPFAGDPYDPARELEAFNEPADEPLLPADREGLLDDLGDLEVFQALLGPRGVQGLVVDCDDCQEPHYFGWDLLRGNLRALLDSGTSAIHEPAFSPEPSDYVSWDYARGFADASLADNHPADPVDPADPVS